MTELRQGPEVSVIIRAYNEEAFIERLLIGIKQQTFSSCEIILVDSGSTDQTIDIARPYVDRIVTIKKEDFSFGRALNRGCEVAQGNYLVFVSAHVYPVDDQWLQNLINPLKNDNYVMSYGRQIGDHRTKFSEHQVFASWFPSFDVPDQQHPFCNNANAAVRSDWWSIIPYDESLTGLEDLKWTVEAMQRGGRIYYSAAAAIFHIHEESFQAIYHRYFREAKSLRIIFPGTKFDVFDLIKFTFLGIFSDIRALLTKKPVGFIKSLREIVMFRWNQYFGTYRGHRHRGPVDEYLRYVFYYPGRNNRHRESGVEQASTLRLKPQK